MNADLVTVWNGALETAWVKAQQRAPDPVLRPDHSPTTADLVWAYLEQYPGSTIRQISEATGRDVGQVGPALYRLLTTGKVVQEGVEETPGNGRPFVRWRVRRD